MSARHSRPAQRISWLAALLGLVGWAGGGAEADLYRCQRPDGSVVFSDSQATCPGASEHRPAGAVQKVASPVPAKRSQPLERLGTPRDLDAEREAHWREKKLAAQRELAEVSAHIDELEPFVTICNRGGYLFRTQANGLRKKVSCDSVRDDFASLERESLRLREYLEHGLGEECRTAGCLPGWLR